MLCLAKPSMGSMREFNRTWSQSSSLEAGFKFASSNSESQPRSCISRGNQCGGVAKCRLFSQASLFASERDMPASALAAKPRAASCAGARTSEKRDCPDFM